MNNFKYQLSIITIAVSYSQELIDCVRSSKEFEDFSEQIIVIPEIDELQKNNISKIRKNIKFVKDDKKGVYNAINIGVKTSIGRFIFLLHGDNLFTENASIIIRKQIKNSELTTQFGCSLLKYNKKYENFYNYRIKKSNLVLGLHPPHPGLLLAKKDFNKLGDYDENYKICSDLDYYLRIMKNEIFVFYIDSNIVISKQGGLSTNGIGSIIKIMLERVHIINSYYGYI